MFSEELRGRIAANLDAFERRELPQGILMRAAVAAALVSDDAGVACFVLTRRASRPGRHAGQWALPGGRCDAEEGAEDTALRELLEEVGLSASRAGVLGLLDDYETRSGFLITPVVVWVDSKEPFRVDPHEVAIAYRVPLSDLESPRVPVIHTIPESPRPVISVPLPDLDTLVHAPTAAILFQLREVALAGRSTRVAHYEQPVFAWQ